MASLTGYLAISTALYMGFDDIYLAGFDSDSFKTLYFDSSDGYTNILTDIFMMILIK